MKNLTELKGRKRRYSIDTKSIKNDVSKLQISEKFFPSFIYNLHKFYSNFHEFYVTSNRNSYNFPYELHKFYPMFFQNYNFKTFSAFFHIFPKYSEMNLKLH